MWGKSVAVGLAALLSIFASAQDARLEDSILALTGASGLEELGEDEMERFQSYEGRPLRLNLAPMSRLVSSGLLTRYQAASLRDYTSRHGDVLSVAELALVDGFGEQTARALEPFVSFETAAAPGTSSQERGRVRVEALARGAAKSSEGQADWNAALKCRVGVEDRWELSVAAKSPYGSPVWPPQTLSGSAAVYGRRRLGKLVVGDFNARFGQGLLQWSGFSLSGFSTASAFARHPSGISPAWTLSPGSAHRGVAADFTFGRVCVSTFGALPSLLGGNVTYYARSGQLGVTALSEGKASLDWRWSLGKLDLYGETAAAREAVAAVAGLTYNPAYGVRISALARVYPADFDSPYAGAVRSSSKTCDERGAALGLDFKSLSVAADAALHPAKGTQQHKVVLKYAPQVSPWLLLGLRLSSRWRPMDGHPWRNEARAEATVTLWEAFSIKGCADFCRCMDLSWATFVECGYKSGTSPELSVYLRGTAFVVDHWDDRIYLYERDLPGAFNVPAYYGRGCSAFLTSALKWKRLKLGVRAAVTAYPGMREKKPGKAELKFQCQFTL